MANTTFQGPVRVGRQPNVGILSAFRQLELPVTAVANTDLTLYLPKCQILSFQENTRVAYTGATVALSIGNTVGGAQMVSAADIKALGVRNPLTVVAAGAPLLYAWPGGDLNIRIAQGTPTAVGNGTLFVEYLPLEDSLAA